METAIFAEPVIGPPIQHHRRNCRPVADPTSLARRQPESLGLLIVESTGNLTPGD